MRLLKKLAASKASMDEAYGKLASFVTELKMDHDNGEKESDRLTTFLSCVFRNGDPWQTKIKHAYKFVYIG